MDLIITIFRVIYGVTFVAALFCLSWAAILKIWITLDRWFTQC